jgi:hypothetical protein
MLTAIIDRLKTGSIRNVVLFGDGAKMPPPPYVVVKPEKDARGENRTVRIIVHQKQGEQDQMEDYLFKELVSLLGRNIILTGRNGSRNRLVFSGEWTETITGNDDNTIAMEKIYIIPGRIK